jgi:hypothetical protein
MTIAARCSPVATRMGVTSANGTNRTNRVGLDDVR